jgi:hypothetical protein
MGFAKRLGKNGLLFCQLEAEPNDGRFFDDFAPEGSQEGSGACEDGCGTLNKQDQLFGDAGKVAAQGLHERPQTLDITCDADIAEDEHCRHRRRFLQCGECGDEEAQSDLSLDPIIHEVDNFDVEVACGFFRP